MWTKEPHKNHFKNAMTETGGGARGADDLAACLYCGKLDDGVGASNNMVQCDSCTGWAHFNCADVDDKVADKEWVCNICTTQKNACVRTPPNQQNTQEAGVSYTSGIEIIKENSNKKADSVVSSKSSQKATYESSKLELAYLEERKKVELEFLKEKHDILRKINEANEDEVSIGREEDKLDLFDTTDIWVAVTQQQQGNDKQPCQMKLNDNTEQTSKVEAAQRQCNNMLPSKFMQQPQQQQFMQQPQQQQFMQQPQQQDQQQWRPQLQQQQLQQWQQQQDITAQINARKAVPRDLPMFSGKPEEWPLFFSSFQNSTRLCGFSHDEILLRLQRSLKGRAQECVGSKLLMPSLVPEIMETLGMMFGRPDQIINNSLLKLRAQPHIHPNKLESLISFAFEVRNVTATMEAANMEEYLNNPLLVQELIEKLPTQIRMDWARHNMSNKTKNLKTFSNWLYALAEAASSVISTSSGMHRQENRLNYHREEKAGYTPRSIVCYMCGGNHMLVKCKEFLQLKYNEKWNKTKELGLCPICLKKHEFRTCRERKECRINGCKKMHHALGWTVYGQIDNKAHNVNDNFQMHICECDNEIALQSLILSWWKVDTMAEMGERQQRLKHQQEKLCNHVEDRGDHFEVKLLWKAENIALEDNYNMALQRLKCFENKIGKEPSLKQYVTNHIASMMQKGYVRKLSPNEIAETHSKKWYLPIFTVRNPNKPEKIRMVWDAAAKYRGVSLNDCLEKGPDMLNSLIDVLFNFRMGKYGICGDISEMFHRVYVNRSDQQAQRFLWRNDKNQIPDVYVLNVLSFGASCSPALAQFVRIQNAIRFEEKYPRAVQSIVERHYVDDMMDSVNTEEEAVRLTLEVREVHKQGNFHIRNWLSNSKAVLQAVGVTNATQNQSDQFCKAGRRIDQVIEPSKVLGLWWDSRLDVLTFSLKFTKANEEILHGNKLPTKRQLLRLMMSIFDPLGFLSFFLIKIKILFQHIWRSVIDWDDEIPEACTEEWGKWLKALSGFLEIKIPRHYFGSWTSDKCIIELHMFVDAGENAYAAVGYFRIVHQKEIKITLVGSKAKVGPLKPVSIPRMELMAAVLGTRLSKSIRNGHDAVIENIYFWTDSKNVLSWLRSNPMRYQQFITYRVGEIQESTQLNQWKYIPTKMNIADMATEQTPIVNAKTWFNGPEFLNEGREHWPKQPIMEVNNEELRSKERSQLVGLHVDYVTVVNYTRFSKWERLLRAMAYVKLFIRSVKLRVLTRKKKNESNRSNIHVKNLRSKDLQWAQDVLCQIAQREAFSMEIAALQKNCDYIIPKSSQLKSLTPFIDHNMTLRMRGRLENAKFIEETTKNPIILPKHHKITMLVVDWYHRKNRHVNHEGVVNEIFQKYHITGLRQVLKTVRKSCQMCKIRQACPQPPEMGSLPEGRLTPFSRPFTHVGVDFFGPFLTMVGRRSEKRYGVVFTCLTCRAVHVEMAYSLSMNSCIMTIRNFITRRGNPRVFYSDNGTNLRAAEKELKTTLANISFHELQAEFTSQETDWKFIPPASPHMGGAWERMVHSIKHVLYKIVTPETKLSDERLQNLFHEVEYIVNSRPLTYLALDDAEEEVLTPNHFLLGSSSGQKPPGEFVENDKYVKSSWRHSQYLADCFWKRWVAEVLPTLTRRTAWFEKTKPLAVGDVVIIVDPNSPRYSWPKGIIIKTIVGRDGQTRSAIVKTAQGHYHRPTAKIAVLDVKPIEINGSDEIPNVEWYPLAKIPGGECWQSRHSLSLSIVFIEMSFAHSKKRR